MNKKQIVASLNKIANELDNSGLYAEASTVTKVMSRLAADDDYSKAYFEKYPDAPRNYEEGYARKNPDYRRFTEDPSGYVGDILDPERERGDLYGNYMDNNKNNVIDALAEAIQDMEDNDMISDAEIAKVTGIMNELKRILKY
jgi:hypothetical protein